MMRTTVTFRNETKQQRGFQCVTVALLGALKTRKDKKLSMSSTNSYLKRDPVRDLWFLE